MAHFTPLSSTLGGALIGLSVALLWITNGRIAGISGIAGGLMRAQANDAAWRLFFLFGLVAAPLLAAVVAGVPRVVVNAGPGMLIVAGLLVGFGTRLGSGCTSGHGVCGMARLSRRSIAATFLFMAAGVVTVFTTRFVVGV